MHKIYAKQPTFLKKYPDQSSELDTADKVYCPAGKVYEVESYDTEKVHGHWFVELSHSAGSWYVFASHWDIPWDRQRRRINQAGFELIKRFEGLKLEAYQDSVGVWTIGYGTTRINGKPVTPGLQIIKPEAESFLLDDVAVFEKYVSDTIKTPLTDNQFSALVSLCYNCGYAPLKQGNTIRKALDSGDYQGAADGFLLWVKAGNTRLPGLVRRRKAERDLFLQQG